MKNQALFSSKDKSKKLKCRLLQFLFGTLRVNQMCQVASHTVELQWHEHLWDHENMFETGVVRANEC